MADVEKGRLVITLDYEKSVEFPSLGIKIKVQKPKGGRAGKCTMLVIEAPKDIPIVREDAHNKESRCRKSQE